MRSPVIKLVRMSGGEEFTDAEKSICMLKMLVRRGEVLSSTPAAVIKVRKCSPSRMLHCGRQ